MTGAISSLWKSDSLFLRVIHFTFILFTMLFPVLCSKLKINCSSLLFITLCKRQHSLPSLIKKEQQERFALLSQLKRATRAICSRPSLKRATRVIHNLKRANRSFALSLTKHAWFALVAHKKSNENDSHFKKRESLFCSFTLKTQAIQTKTKQRIPNPG